MTSTLVGDKRRRKQLELSQERWKVYRGANERDGVLAAIAKAQGARPFTITERLQIGSLRERLGYVLRDLATARVRAEHAAEELGEDAGVASFFGTPARQPQRTGPIRLDTSPVRGASPVRRTVPAYVTRDIVPGRC